MDRGGIGKGLAGMDDRTMRLPGKVPVAASFKYDFLVFVGRFRPFHNGHLRVMRRALELSRHLIVLVGSSKQARSPKNPFTAAEVETCIRGAFGATDNARIVVRPLLDTYNNTAWITNVQQTVNGIKAGFHDPAGRMPVIGLIGHSKDKTSFYLDMFPFWQGESVDNVDGLSATDIRDPYYLDPRSALAAHAADMPPSTVGFLETFATTPEFGWLASEAAFYADLREKYAELPHPPTFVTVEAVVVQSACILLVERDRHPGMGLLALPGGFPAAHERLRAAMVRRLQAETRIKVHPDTLDRCVTASATFDYPWRSERGRLVTHGYRVELRNERGGLTKVGGRALWVPNAEIDPEGMFEDHYHVIQTMLGMANQRE